MLQGVGHYRRIGKGLLDSLEGLNTLGECVGLQVLAEFEEGSSKVCSVGVDKERSIRSRGILGH
jgi:hypothetical protein